MYEFANKEIRFYPPNKVFFWFLYEIYINKIKFYIQKFVLIKKKHSIFYR